MRPARLCWSSAVAAAAAVVLGGATAGCGSPPSTVTDGGVVDAEPVDAEPPDAAVTRLGPALAFDTIELVGQNLVFQYLGSQFLNSQLADLIDGGQFFLVIELRDLDDASGAEDDDIDLGVVSANDSDTDATDNFDANDPEQLIAAALSIDADGRPLVIFADASIAAHRLVARGTLEISLPGDFPLPLEDAVIEGTLVADSDASRVDYMANGNLSGTVAASIMGLVPNLLTGTCPGATMLDVLINGCGIGFASQPDVDRDDDGLETLFVDEAGVINRCVDGDGTTEILGADCWSNPAMADGYRMVFDIHATRVILVAAL